MVVVYQQRGAVAGAAPFVTRLMKIALAWVLLLASALLGLLLIGVAPLHGLAGVRGTSQTSPRDAQGESTSGHAIYLVIDDQLLAGLAGEIPSDFRVVPLSKLNQAAVIDAVGAGSSLVWVGDGERIPNELWVGTFRPTSTALAVSGTVDSPLNLNSFAFRKSSLSSAYIKPTKLLPVNNVDEQPRAQFLPILEARDRFGQAVGFPAILMQHYAPSTVRHRFAGAECFFFLFDHPAEALDPGGWSHMLGVIAARFRAHLQIKRVTTDYASYHLGERVLIRARVANWRPQAVATEIHFYTQAPGEREFQEFLKLRRCPDAQSESDAVADFLPRARPGLWKIRVEAWQDPVRAEDLGISGMPVPVDRRDVGIVVLDGPVRTPPLIALNGPSIRMAGHDGFWTGTNYYPSTSWWDWLWRDFHPLKVAEDFTAMRRTGYRLVRIWLDPVLDERSLRATDAAIYLAAQNGIVLDVCVFTTHQWVRTIGFERENGEHVSVDFTPDTSLSSFSLQHLASQQELLRVIAKRWRGAGNIIYDISNEPVVKDIDPAHFDRSVLEWKDIPAAHGPLRDTLLFRDWARQMSAAIRQAGGTQLLIAGQLRGGDNYLGNRDADIESWHSYTEPEMTGLTQAYTDPVCSSRPVILEEFGAWGVWNDEARYDGDVHYALAAGAAAAMSYEWGISWFPPELNFWPPLADMVRHHPSLADVRDKPDFSRAVGIFPAPSGFNWGSIYHGTPFPAAAAVALARPARMGQELGRALRPEKVYVVVPTSFNGKGSDTTAVTNAFKKLWQDKIAFGVVQEDSLASLPKTTHVLICPNGVTPESNVRIESLRQSGVQVFMGPEDDWQEAANISKVSVEPGDSINLLTRRTITGTLYSLMGTGPMRPISITTEGHVSVQLGLSSYAMVHDTSNGVNLLEAAGTVAINGRHFCAIEQGRAIIAADDRQDLVHSKRLRVLATEPTVIRFTHPIQSIEVLPEDGTAPLASLAPPAESKFNLQIDSELVRYIVRIVFSD